MRTYKWVIPACIILVLAFILGVTGAVKISSGGSVIKSDRFIGVLITTEELDLYDNDNPVPDGYRFFAKRIEKNRGLSADGSEASFVEVDYDFDGISGMKLMNPDMPLEGDVHYGTGLADEGLSDISIDINESDDSRSICLEGTVYMVPQAMEKLFWFNRIYQSDDGSVYAVRGDPISVGGTEDTVGSVGSTLSEEQHWSENGKNHSESFSVKITLSFVYEPVSVSVLQYNASDELSRRDRYVPDDVPNSIAVLPDTEYVIVDTERKTPAGVYKHARDIIDQDTETVNIFRIRDDGIIVKNTSHELIWP